MPQWKIKRREILKTTMEERRDEKDSRNNKAEKTIYMYISYIYMEYLQKTLRKKKNPEICNIRNCNKM